MAAAMIQLSKCFQILQNPTSHKNRTRPRFHGFRWCSYGLLGVNGAGKSTTLRLLAGTELPNAGKVRRSVRVSWPLGFAGGFHPLMSGRENVRFVARIYGQNVREVLDFVEDFSELGDCLDAPIKTYSSGMITRLAFELSMAVEFDCYLIELKRCPRK